MNKHNRCNFCNVYIKDETMTCPLCGGVLEMLGDGENTYPDIRKKMKVVKLLFKIMLFVTGVTTFTCIVISFMTEFPFKWSFVIALSLLFLNTVMYTFVKEDAGYRVRSFTTAILGVLLLIYIDFETGFHGWSINYVMPSTIIFIEAAIILLMFINIRNFQSYTTILIGMIFVSLIPLILALLDIITSPLLSIIAFGISLFTLLGVLLFGGQRVKNELHRRFYIEK